MSNPTKVPAAIRATELRFGVALRDVFLSGRYDGWTKEEVCNDLAVSVRTLDHWMARCGVGFQRVIVDLHDGNADTPETPETENREVAA